MRTTGTTTGTTAETHPVLLSVAAETTSSGDARRLDAGPLSLLQYPATEAGSGPAAVHLRLRTENGHRSRPLTGPTSGGSLLADGTILTVHDGLEARTRLQVAADGEAWAWSIHLRHGGDAPLELDLLHTLDIALTERDAIRRNEQYVAQYLDLTPVQLPQGGGREASLALAVRQNMPGPAAPWAAVGASTPLAEWGTDALQLLDRRTGEGLDPARDLPSERLQHEHTLVALRTAPLVFAPGQEWRGSFWGFALADHPAATGPQDATLIRQLQERIEGSLAAPAALPAAAAEPAPAEAEGVAPDARPATSHPATSHPATTESAASPLATSLLAAAPPLAVQEADHAQCEKFAGGPLRLLEEDGRLLSAFSDRGHLVTAAKERLVLRPHGHIQQVHGSGTADLDTVASTVWMRGVFCSQLTLGHASTGALTTVRRSYLGLDRSGGVRLLLRTADGGWSLLSTPSLWLTDGASSQWLYLTETLTLRISSEVLLGQGALVDIEVSGEPGPGAELLLVVGTESAELALQVIADGCPVEIGDDSALFSDGSVHGTGLLTARLDLSQSARVRLLHGEATPGAPRTPGAARTAANPVGSSAPVGSGAAGEPSAAAPSAAYRPRLPALRGGGEEVAAVGETLGWLAQNASIHFRSPRGLEQYSGGAWGTRDVCQGPVGLLLATDEPAVLRRTLLSVMAAQQEDGTWPQWFDYLPGHTGPGMRDAHGDVVYWPLLALGEYLAVTGDHGMLEETAPWVGEQAMGEPTTVLDHLSRALDHIVGHRTEDPRLPAYGHGDWNDSLQPARPELAEHMCSTWTTELEVKALTVLADALAEDADARGAELERRCRALAAGAEQGLREHLLVDGELAGYAILDGGQVEHLVHPSDTTTGVRHGSLQMIHAVADELLTPAEARHHLALLREHLAGPTGLYLFDRPLSYHGGEMHIFQRAEAATFWGREVGLMYMHAHLRWIEALTHLGEADLAWTELLKAVPIGLGQRVRGARVRQANCYYSSSDAVFPDRYTASENPGALFAQSTGFEGGWRVYSSGPGLLLRIIVEDLLGVRRRGERLEIDPVLPAALDGIEAEIPYAGGFLTVRFLRGVAGCGVRELSVDGQVIVGTPLTARYREAGISVPVEQVRAGAVLDVRLG
ncbi:GH36-type glycosyl hydrolase domain-containing protein [uncultured Brachybacterium sp.]|uniref:GH36-type glycosyl hydrolase domain-containing protein n=1 Tax=uncultured Brachybacterium sp. TaxID=189680 RepID=UPI00261547F7|nr:cellobiose phosphorylase [uncultured Brachybacterium sp.]